MANGGITLDINTKYNGEGMTKLNAAMTKSATVASKASTAVTQIEQALGGADKGAARFLGTIGKISGAFMSGGAWSLAVAGIASLISGFKKAMSIQKEFHEQEKKSLQDVEIALKKQAKMREELAKKNLETEKEFRKKKEKEQMERNLKINEATKNESLAKSQHSLEKQLADLEISGLKDKLNTDSDLEKAKIEAQIREKEARARLQAAKEQEKIIKSQGNGDDWIEWLKSGFDVEMAQKELEKVIADNANNIKKAQKDEAEARKAAEEKMLNERKKREKERQDKEKKMEKEKIDKQKKLVEEEIDSKKKWQERLKEQMNDIKNNPENVKQGQNFNSWDREQKERQKNEKQQQEQENKNIRLAENRALNIWKRSTVDGKWMKGTERQRAEWEKLSKYVGNIRDQKHIKTLEDNVKRIDSNIDELAKTLKNLGT